MRWLLLIGCLAMVGCAGPRETTAPIPYPSQGPIPFALGIVVFDASPDWRDSHGVARAVRVETVVKDSPAQHAGMERGDVIVAVNGVPVDWAQNFRTQVYRRAGQDCELTVYKGQAKIQLKVLLNQGN